MSSELIKTNAGYIVPNMSNDVTDGIMEELDGLNISLDKIKIPAGGGLTFEVPGDDTDSPDSEKEIIGVIVDHYPLNSFWTENFKRHTLTGYGDTFLLAAVCVEYSDSGNCRRYFKACNGTNLIKA